MPTISAQFKVFAEFDMKDIMQSRMQVQVLHNKGWRPLFEFTLHDVTKLFVNNKQINKKKGKTK